MIAHGIGVPGPKAPKKNLGPLDRALRVAIGGSLALVGVTLLFRGGTPVWLLLDLALAALGTDLLVSGIRGYCPLYKRLGWSTAPKRR
jgi:hypothetical protein